MALIREMGLHMTDCPYQPECRLHAELPAISPHLLEQYCKIFCSEEFHTCALHKISDCFGPDKVPLDLLPSELKRADKLIEDIRKWQV